MLRLQLLLLSVLFLTTAFAGPIRQKAKRSFKIPRLRQANYVPNGKFAYRKALFKFGFEDITFKANTIASKLQAATNTSIAATDDEDGVTVANPSQGDSEFLSPVSVGGQTLVMDFDTGSSDM